MFVYLVLGIVAIAILWFAVFRKRPQPAEKPLKNVTPNRRTKTVQWVKAGAKKVASPFVGVQGRYQQFVARRRGASLPERLKGWLMAVPLLEKGQWAAQPETIRAFTAWLSGLSKQDAAEFSKQVSGFCDEIGIELPWLVDGKLDEAPDLKPAIEGIVIHYALACWKGKDVKARVEAFATYQSWQANPTAGEHAALTSQLFVKSVEAGLITAPAPDLLLANQKKRQAYVVQAMHQAAGANRAAFNEIFAEVTASKTVKQPSPVAAPSAASAPVEAPEVLPAAPAERPPQREGRKSKGATDKPILDAQPA